jgi:hypothetical protein
MNQVIGLCGVAGAGKDTMYSLLNFNNPNIKRFALADALKTELFSFIKELYNIDIFNCSREEKNIIRPILVEHGKIRRKQSNGTHWTSLITSHINDYIRESSKNIAVITDVRYAEYEKDEIFWVKNILGGKLIHISMIDNGKFVPPANIDEEKNDPIIKENTDLFIEWEKEPNFSLKSSGLNKYVKTVEQFIKKQI